MYNTHEIISRLQWFNSDIPEEVYNFISSDFSGLFAPMQVREEFVELLKIFRSLKPKYVLEIGTANGGTLFCFTKLAAPDATIISIDLPNGPFGGGYPEHKIPLYRAFAGKNQVLHLIRKDSHSQETLTEVLKVLNGNYLDFLFIDGDHTYDGVKKDFEMYQSLVRTGGVIAFHDIVKHPPELRCEVEKLWQQIKHSFQHKELIKDINQNWAGIGVLVKSCLEKPNNFWPGRGNMKRVLLINPHDNRQDGYTNPPLGLLYLAGSLVKCGIDTHVTDGSLYGFGAIENAVKSLKPDVVGITCLTATRKRSVDVARYIKSVLPKSLVVFGGPHATIMPEQLLKHYPEIDCIVRGEGEATFLDVVMGKSFKDIDGLVYRDGDRIIKNRPRKYFENLDEIPFPAWHLVDLWKYPGRDKGVFNGVDVEKSPRIPIVFSRGCIGRCNFCSSWWIWRGWRCRSPKNMVDEIELLVWRHGIRHFCFVDDTFTADVQASIDLCNEIIARDLKIAFFCTTRADCVSEELFYSLKRAGCYKISFGIESASQRVLDKIGKMATVEQSEKAIKMAKAAGLLTCAMMISGNVGETPATVKQSIEFLRKTQPDDVGIVGGLWVFPGTQLYRTCKEKGFITDEFWLGDEHHKLYTLEYNKEQIDEFTKRIYFFNTDFGELKMETKDTNIAGSERNLQPGLSVVINTLNEEKCIERCLQSVADIADEIIIVDMHSDDRTVEIAKKYTDKIFYIDKLGCVEPARNFALSKATKEWVLILDADECLSKTFRDNIRGVIANNAGVDVFLVPFNTKILGRWIQSTGWGRDKEWHPRLFRNGMVRWPEDGAVHGQPLMKGRVEKLPLSADAAINHYNYEDISDFIDRLNRYTSLEAAKLKNVGESWSVEKMVKSARDEFINRYTPEADGVHSLILSVAMAFYRFISWAKLWEIDGQTQARLPKTFIDLLKLLINDDGSVNWTEINRNQPLENLGIPQDNDSENVNEVPAWVVNRLNNASQFLKIGDLASARKEIESVINERCIPVDVILAAGSIFYQLGDLTSALKYFSRAHEMNPNDPITLVKKATVAVELGLINEFETSLAKALEIDPDNIEALRLLGRLNLENKRYQDAANVYFRILKQDPKDINVLLSTGRCFYEVNDYETAELIYREVLKIDPDNQIAKENLEILEKKRQHHGDQDGTSKRLEVLNRIADSAADGNCIKQEEQVGPANVQTEIECSGPEEYLKKADDLYNAGKKVEAAQLLKKAINNGLRTKDIFEAYGNVCFQLDDYYNSFKAFQEAVKLVPRDIKLRINLACIAKKVQDYSVFESSISAVLQIDPSNVDALRLLANARMETGQFNEAANVYQTLSTAFPEDIQVLLPLGRCYYELRKYSLAKDTFEKILELDPANEIAQENLKVVNRKLSRECESTNSGKDKKKAVTIIIPVYNKLQYTRQCIESVFAHTPPELFDLVIVDNSSNDGSVEYFEGLEVGKKIRLIKNRENVGFGKACNQGAELANSKYILFLNNDTEVQKGWLESLLREIEADDTIGVIGPKLIFTDGKLQKAGGNILSSGDGWDCGRHDDPSKPQYNILCEVDYICGACLMVRTDLFKKLGGFNSIYGMAYYEDTDLCFSVRQAGYKVVYCPESCVIHHESVTSSHGNGNGVLKYLEINKSKFREKWEKELKYHEPAELKEVPFPLLTISNDRSLRFPDRRVFNKIDMDKRRALVFFPQNPFPPRTGAHQALLGYIRALKLNGYEVILASSVDTSNYPWSREKQEEIESTYKIATVVYPVNIFDRQWRQTMASNRMLSFSTVYAPPGLSFWFFNCARMYKPDLVTINYGWYGKLALQNEFPECQKIMLMHDLVSYNHWLQSMLFSKWGDPPFNVDNIPDDLLDDQWLEKAGITVDPEELSMYDKYDWTLTFASWEERFLKSACKNTKVLKVPLFLSDFSNRATDNKYTGAAIFIGAENIFNAQAVAYYARKIAKRLNSVIPDFEVQVAGGVCRIVNDYGLGGIRFLNFVPQLRALYEQARFAICPVIAGTGQSVKIFEAMANGLPVVAHKNAARSSLIRHGENGFIASSADEFADYLIRLWKDPGLCRRLGAAARETIDGFVISKDFEATLNTVFERSISKSNILTQTGR
jgi:radical SAM superfamily enzyme YgiQ (UPF0313 family)/GT2 family glycosyltransferase/cytochrome c-type biogenesis protein CcmH/NrfG/predicted O-methyltransferase YrrM